MDHSPPGSSVHGILQARIPEWVAISFSTVSSRPRDRTFISCIAGRCFTTEPLGNPNTSNNSLQNIHSVHEERLKADEKDTTQGSSSVSPGGKTTETPRSSRVGRPQRQMDLNLTINNSRAGPRWWCRWAASWEPTGSGKPSEKCHGRRAFAERLGREVVKSSNGTKPRRTMPGTGHMGHSLSWIWGTCASHEQCWQQQVLEKILDPGEFWQVRETEGQCPLFRDTESRAREVKKIWNTLWIPIKIIFIESTSHMESKDPTSHPGLPLHHKLWALEKMSFFFS